MATGCFKSDAVKPLQAEGGGNSTAHSHNSTPTHEEVCAGFVSAAPVTEERQRRGVKHFNGSTDNPVHDLTAKLTAFYAILNPSKLCDVAKLAVKFKDNADKLNSDLRRRYDGLDLSCPEAEIWRYRYAQALRDADQEAAANTLEVDYLTTSQIGGGLRGLGAPVPASTFLPRNECWT